MRHQTVGRKFGRKKDDRDALMRLLTKSLIEHGKIKTTEAKAKELRPYVEKMVSKAREKNVSARRLVVAKIGKSMTKKLFDEIAPRYKDRPGGYTRVIKLGNRKGDASPIAIIEFV